MHSQCTTQEGLGMRLLISYIEHIFYFMPVIVLLIQNIWGGGGLKLGVGHPSAPPFCVQPCSYTLVILFLKSWWAGHLTCKKLNRHRILE